MDKKLEQRIARLEKMLSRKNEGWYDGSSMSEAEFNNTIRKIISNLQDTAALIDKIGADRAGATHSNDPVGYYNSRRNILTRMAKEMMLKLKDKDDLTEYGNWVM
jgi:hypothetical protein